MLGEALQTRWVERRSSSLFRSWTPSALLLPRSHNLTKCLWFSVFLTVLRKFFAEYQSMIHLTLSAFVFYIDWEAADQLSGHISRNSSRRQSVDPCWVLWQLFGPLVTFWLRDWHGWSFLPVSSKLSLQDQYFRNLFILSHRHWILHTRIHV